MRKIISLIFMFPMFTACNSLNEEKAISSDYVKLIGSKTIKVRNLIGFDKFIPVAENKKINFLKFNSKTLAKNYCIGSIADIPVDVISINPLIVNCGQYSITDGVWKYNLYQNNQRVIGANKKYVFLSDLTLINKHTGKPSENNKIKKNVSQYSRLNKYSNDSLAVSGNNRFFTTSIVGTKSYLSFEKKNSIVINEILKNRNENPIIKLLKNSSGDLSVIKMVVSDEGKYLFLVIGNTKRGVQDLYFYVIDVNNKNVLFKDNLEINSRYKENIFLDYQNENILMSYSSPLKLYLYKIKTRK